jgi:hypothetical protein
LISFSFCSWPYSAAWKSDPIASTSRLSLCRLTELLAGSIDLTMQHQAPTNAPGNILRFLRLSVPVSLKRVGREMRMLVENADDQTAADPSLRHHIQVRLIQNPKLTVHDIAREERVSAAYLYTLLRLHLDDARGEFEEPQAQRIELRNAPHRTLWHRHAQAPHESQYAPACRNSRS